MNRAILALFLVHVILDNSVAGNDPHYLIVSPTDVYWPGSTVTLGVDLFGKKSCDVNVTLRTYDRLLSSAVGRFSPGKHGELKLKVPDSMKTSSATLKGEVCGVKTKERRIGLGRFHNSIFIQTDKPIYKPGQKIRMRIISINHDLKPVGDKASLVTVEEPSGSRVMQWSDVKLEDGIASLELQLSKEPVLGDWKIKAVVGKEKVTQTIEVAKYVLPKFEVKITPPPYMALDQSEFTTTICARYTYGKPVKGKLSALICLKHQSGYYNRQRRYRTRGHSTCHNITRQVEGCSDIILSREDLNVNSVVRLWSTQLTIDAAVTETLTGIKLTAKKTKRRMLRRSVKLDFDGTPKKFKPGMPFTYILKVTRPDGSPVSGVKVKVTITRGYFYFYGSSSMFYDKTFTVQNGLIVERIKKLAHNANSLNFRAELLDKSPYVFRGYNHPVSKYFTAKAWYSPSLSYLQISKTTKGPAKVGTDGSLKVRYTVRNDTGNKIDIYYSVFCKGNVITSGVKTQYHPYVNKPASTTAAPTTLPTTPTTNRTATNSSVNPTTLPVLGRRIIPWWRPPTVPPLKTLPPPELEEFEIKFPVTLKMVPSCRVLVYYVREDKETVADSIVYDIEDVLENQVSVSFSDNEKKPGEKTKLILKASPGSRVAFVAVDKSVHLLRAGNELTKDKVMPLLNRLDPGRSRNRNDKCRSWHPWRRGKRSIIFPRWRSGPEDASEAFNEAGVIFLSNLKIFTQPCPKPILLPRMRFRSGTDVAMKGQPGPDSRARIGSPLSRKKPTKAAKPVRIRKEFPETWLWADEKLSASSEEKTIEVKVPDTITTWIANGFAMSSVAGIGVSNPTSIKAFQPFFVQMTLPYSVIRGEEIPITVTVFNYMSTCVPIKLELNRESDDYDVTSYHIHKMCVCGDSGQSVKFSIVPNNLGHIDLTVKAQTSTAKLCPKSSITAADAVTRKLLVEPEGIKQEYTKGTFLCPKGGQYQEVFDLSLPKDIVPGSVYPTLSIIGDIMGPALSNLDRLLAMPYGCGEQNMAKFAPNIYIMDYLTKTGQVTKAIKEKAELYMRSGYQRELIYKRKSGSYSAFGNSDAQGSMMLTAFVVRSFARAKNYIFVDEKQVDHSIAWFAKKQARSGCFPNYGRVFSRSLQGGVSSEQTITAYVTIALLEAGKDKKDPLVDRALSCLANNINSIKDSYTTALIAYTFALANHSKADYMMKQLRSKAITAGGQTHWSASSDKTVPTTPPPYWWYYRTPSADVEMTGYALLAIMKHGDSQAAVSGEVLNIIRWLSKQRNSYGGFSSTQDTCVALQALSEFAGMAYNGRADVNSSDLAGSFKVKDLFSHDFVITKDTRLVLQRVELPKKLVPGKVEFTAKGTGCALVQATVKYNIPSPTEVPAFRVKVDVRRRRSTPDEEKTPCNPLKLAIKAKWLKEDVSNMAVVDIKLVTGFSVREESLQRLANIPDLNFKRYDIDGQNVMLYFNEIKDISFSIDVHQDTLVKKMKPAVVKVYDYYNPESQAKVMYKISEKDCYGDRIKNSCPRCIVLNGLNDLPASSVTCSTTMSRVKSTQGLIKISRRDNMNSSKYNKQKLPYVIPEYCPCEEIYDGVKSLIIRKGSYFQESGNQTSIVLDGGTTIVKWVVKPMKRQLRKIIAKCGRQG